MITRMAGRKHNVKMRKIKLRINKCNYGYGGKARKHEQQLVAPAPASALDVYLNGRMIRMGFSIMPQWSPDFLHLFLVKRRLVSLSIAPCLNTTRSSKAPQAADRAWEE